jgi:ribosome-binding protein aMBF1 (putative translation factor)
MLQVGMPTPRQLEQKAEAHEAEAVELEGYLKATRELVADFEAAIAVKREEAARFRRMAKSAAGTNEVLHKRLRPSSVNEPTMEKSHRLAISEGHKGDADPFAKAIRAKGFSQNSLAKRVGLNQAVLSLHRKKMRRIKLSTAKAIEKLTDWPADAKHWPCGIVSDGE